MATLTDKFIRRQKPRGKRSYEISCSSTPGLILRVLPSGKQVLFVRIRGDGRDTKVRLGLYGDDLSLEEARLRAVRARSGEPRESHLAVRALVPERRERQHAVAATTMTFDELAREYLARHVNTPNLKPKTKPNYRRAIRVFCDMWGKRPLGQIKFREVEAWHQSKADAPSAANNHLRVLSSMYEKALRWEYYDGRNPARGVKPFKETKRKRYLSKAERRRLKEQLDRSCAEYASKKNTIRWSHAYAIRLLGLTGFRCHEILDLEWDWIDRDNLSIRLPDSKTGDSERPISPAVLDVLDELEKYRRDGVPWVVYGRREQRITYSSLRHAAERIFRLARIKNLRLHDLRHSAASAAISAGCTLKEVGVLLDHKKVSTTERYAHLTNEAARSAARRMTDSIANAEAHEPKRRKRRKRTKK